jgi:hypothetical protein
MNAAVAAVEPVLAFVRASPALAPLLAQTGLANAAPEVLAGALLGIALLTLFIAQAMLSALLRPKSLPPMLACVPVVGGFVKFLKARCCALPRARRHESGCRPTERRRVRIVTRRGRCR